MTDYSKSVYVSNLGIPMLQVIPFNSIKYDVSPKDSVGVYDWKNAIDPSVDTYARVVFYPIPNLTRLVLKFDEPFPGDKFIVVTNSDGANLFSSGKLYVVAMTVTGVGTILSPSINASSNGYYVIFDMSGIANDITEIWINREVPLPVPPSIPEYTLQIKGLFVTLKNVIRADATVEGAVQIEDSGGTVINPATEDTLSSFRDDFNSKVPQPLQFDDNGRVLVNADLQVSDIEIGAVEIKDADTDQRAKVDANGNLQVYMNNPPIAYDSVNDRLKIRVEEDTAGLAKDATLQQALPRNLTEISGVALTGRDWSQDFSNLPGIKSDTENIKSTVASILTTLNNLYNNPISFYVLDNQEVNAPGNSLVFQQQGMKVIELLIVAKGVVGAPSLQFHIDVIEPHTNEVIKTYDGEVITSEKNSYIYVKDDLIGENIRVRWDGTLDSDNYFSNVTAKLIAKR